MEVFKSSKTRKEKTHSAIDANHTDSVTGSLAITNQTIFSLYVDPNTGDNTKHEIILQSSSDDENFYDNGAKVTGCGVADDDTLVTNFVRAKVIVAEGTASTVDITIIAQ